MHKYFFQEGDFVKLVLWFKGEGNKPIYTYDKRSGRLFDFAIDLF